jgi:hypothetical protein
MNQHGPILRRLVAAILVLMPAAQAALPGGDDPKAYTEHDYRQDLLEFNTRTLAGAYQQVGHRDPKWDQPATDFLKTMARYLSYAKTDWYYRPAQLPRAADAEKLARAAIDAGCDDPLVLDMYAVVLNDTHHWSDEAQKLATKAVDGLVAGKYPDYRAMNSARRMLRHLDPDKQHDEFVKYSTLERELAAKSVKSMSINGRFDRRGVWSFVDDDLDSMKAAELKTYYEDVHRGGGDPWLVNLLGGYYHVAAAWEARGGGWANTVGEDGWKTFFSELAEAHKCLAAAHDLEPKFPEAATKMISVAMGEQQNGPGDSPRSWFDRAIAAQLDYHPAYSAYLWALSAAMDRQFAGDVRAGTRMRRHQSLRHARAEGTGDGAARHSKRRRRLGVLAPAWRPR